MGYGPSLLIAMQTTDRQFKTYPKSDSHKYFSCAQSAVSKSHENQLIYPSLHDELILSMHSKPVNVDNNMGLFVGLADFCYSCQ